MTRAFTSKQQSAAPFIIGGFCLLILSTYLLPTIFPTRIGTGYIGLSLAMTTLSVIIWHFKIITPKASLVISLIACVILGFLLPYTSNDSERYLWDGAVFLSGLDPYTVVPNDPVLTGLRDIWPTPDEHAAYPTLYPPGGLTLFAICALAGPTYGIWVWKLMTTFAALGTLTLTYRLLKERGIVRHFPLVAFSPLLLLEAQVGAHLDVFSILGIVAALWCLETDRVILAGLIIGLAATTKFLPAVMVGPYLFYLKPKHAMKFLLSSAGIWVSIYLIMFGLGYKPLGLLPTFFEKWRGGAPLYPLLESLQSAFGASDRSLILSILALAALGFSCSALLAWRRKIEIAILLGLSVPLLLSPVLFPWYLLSLLPLLALRPTWVLFTAITLAPLSYVVLDKWLSEGVWNQANWPAYLLLLGIITAFVADVMIHLRSKMNALGTTP